jgi:hypothetical protein
MELVWISLVVLLCHLARSVYYTMQMTLFSRAFFSKDWIGRLEDGIRKFADDLVQKLRLVTPDTLPTPELRNLWNQARGFEIGVRLLSNDALVNRWTMVLGGFGLVVIHFYFAFFFSFAYVGIGRVSGLALSWPDTFVNCVFLPFFIGDLARNVPLKVLAGVHGALILSISIGSVVSYLRRKLVTLKSIAQTAGISLENEAFRERLAILEEKFAMGASTTSSTLPRSSSSD